MTIGQVARATGVSASSIRFYEATGIIPKAPRKNGVRQYGPQAIDELKAVRLYRAAGISTRGLRAIGAQSRETGARVAVWADVLRARISDLEASMRAARKTKDLLEQAIACRCQGQRERCSVMRAADRL